MPRALTGNLLRIAGALAVGLLALFLFDWQALDPDGLLEKSVVPRREQWNGRLFTASEVADIKDIVAGYQRQPIPAAGGCSQLTILWLGNSQIHSVNQYRDGDHTSPYWLRFKASCADATLPLGISLPDANLQELYLLEEYVTARIPVKMIFLELCFDTLRQDGLRGELAGFTTPADEAAVSREPIGREMLMTAKALWNHHDNAGQNSGLDGFAQQRVENTITNRLETNWPLWRDRDSLSNRFMFDLYVTRNFVLGINASTARKMIPPRYGRNMQALEAILRLAQRRHIQVVGYISPIRQDQPIPYDGAEYARWKQVAAGLLPEYGAKLVNLESLVPDVDWGTLRESGYSDIVHFRNGGHQLVAAALARFLPADEH